MSCFIISYVLLLTLHLLSSFLPDTIKIAVSVCERGDTHTQRGRERGERNVQHGWCSDSCTYKYIHSQLTLGIGILPRHASPFCTSKEGSNCLYGTSLMG